MKKNLYGKLRWMRAAVALGAAVAAGAEPQSQPATGPASAEVKSMIAQLGADAYKDREAAQKWLWDHEAEADAALTEASKSSPDAEVRSRAKAIVEDAALGLTANATEETRALLRLCRSEDINTRRAAIIHLAGSRKLTDRSILSLLENESVPDLKRRLEQAFEPLMPEAIDDHRRAGTLPALLERMEGTGDIGMIRNAAAVRAVMDEFRMPGAGKPKPGDTVGYMNARAKGDWKEALRLAMALNLPDGEEEILGIQGDWAGVVGAMAKNRRVDAYLNGMLAAEVFANNGVMSDETLKKARAQALREDAGNGDRVEPRWELIELMMFGGRTDDAIELMMKGEAHAEAIDALACVERFGDIGGVAEKSRGTHQAYADEAAVSMGRAMLALGESRKADDWLKPIESPGQWNASAMARAMAVRAAAGQADKAQDIFLRMLDSRDPETISAAFSKAFHTPYQTDIMLAWLAAMNSENPALTGPRKAQLLSAIAENRVSAEDAAVLGQLNGASERQSALGNDLARLTRKPPEPIDAAVTAAWPITPMFPFVMEKTAALAANPDKSLLVKLFSRAAEMPAEPADRQMYRYMTGWAMRRAGDPAGEARMREASIALAASGEPRRRLTQLLARAGDDLQVLEEMHRTVRICDLRDFTVADTLAFGGDAARHLALIEGTNDNQLLMFFYVQSVSSFTDHTAPLQIAQFDQALRIRVALKNKDIDGALRQWRVDAAHWRMDSDLAIDVVRGLDAAGRHDEANALFAEVRAHLEGQLKAFPESAMLHNSLAWFLVRTRRDLDAARMHAEKSVALLPESWPAVDTLAEVEWATGSREKAIATEERAAKGMPEDVSIRRRLEHFKKDKPESYDGE